MYCLQFFFCAYFCFDRKIFLYVMQNALLYKNTISCGVVWYLGLIYTRYCGFSGVLVCKKCVNIYAKYSKK